MDSRLVNKYISFVDELSKMYQYDTNICHLLYLIIPAFVTKYSIYKENLILNTFRNVRIFISDEASSTIQAYYTSIPHYDGNMVTTTKYIVLKNYHDISLVQLLDSLVHEFNHAINSYQKEIHIKDNSLLLRTGLTYIHYSLPDLSPLKKNDSYVLEEILNTNQTEEIINIIKSYRDSYHANFNNTIYSLNNETSNQYTSNAYYLENTILRPILENKTFVSTLNSLRISGDIEDIENWFDHIVGKTNSYYQLNQYLLEMMNLESQYSTKKFFKQRIVEKIRDLSKKISDIIDIFNQNCNYR